MKTRTAVLVATDFSPAADEAIRQGHASAVARGAPLVVGHVLPEFLRTRVLFPHEAGADPAEQAAFEAHARDAVRARVDALLGATPDHVDIDVESGSPHAGILQMAERAGTGLIVVGPGTTALRVARATVCPVLVVRPPPPDGPVIGASDFSDAALPALHAAVALAAERHRPLIVLHCLDINPVAAIASAGAVGALPLALIPERAILEMEGAARVHLLRALADMGAIGEVAVVRRPPAVGIVAAAEANGASVVVVGTRGRSGISRFLMGSVAEYVAMHAPCSVLVVPLHPDPVHAEARADDGIAALAGTPALGAAGAILAVTPAPGC